MKRLGRWFKKHFKVEFMFDINWQGFVFGFGWAWNNSPTYFSTGPMIAILFFAFGVDLQYKKNKAFV